MSIQLPPQLEEIIRDKVASGRYHDAAEVVSEALHALDDAERLEELRAALAEGDAQAERGEYELWTPELRAEIRREARQMVAEGRRPNPDVCP
jgi:antitoxin ParD1/3/4